MASAYATFAARGQYCEPYPVTSVATADGDEVATFEPQCEQKMDEAVADRLNDILTLVQQPGGVGFDNGDTGLPVPSAAKTGTTSESFSVWYIGYTPDLVASAMIAGANSDGQPQTLTGKEVGGNVVGYASGSGLAGPMWKAAFAKIVDKLPGSDFTEPEPLPSEPEPLPTDPFDDEFEEEFEDEFGNDTDDGFGDLESTEPPPDTEVPDDDSVTYDYERLAGEE
jgi:membrane peptidoglycan carboxypeptidase